MGEKTSYAALAAGWAKGQFHPAYLFGGPDALLRDEALARLQQAFLAGDATGMNLDRFDGDTATAGQILTAARTLSFFGGRRLVAVRRVQELSDTEAERLAEGVAELVGNNCLVLLSDDKVDGRGALTRAVEEKGATLTFWTPFENQLPAWIVERAASLGKRMALPAARALLETVGPSTGDLARELEKLVLYVGARESLEAEDVHSLAGGNRSLQFLEWDRAFWRKDRAKALDILELLRAQGQPPEALLSALARAFQKVLTGKALQAEKRMEELWSRVWIRSRDAQAEFLEGLRRRSWEELLAVMEDLAAAEAALKTGRFHPLADLTLLVTRLSETRSAA